jgi:hypothetical protein
VDCPDALDGGEGDVEGLGDFEGGLLGVFELDDLLISGEVAVGAVGGSEGRSGLELFGHRNFVALEEAGGDGGDEVVPGGSVGADAGEGDAVAGGAGEGEAVAGLGGRASKFVIEAQVVGEGEEAGGEVEDFAVAGALGAEEEVTGGLGGLVAEAVVTRGSDDGAACELLGEVGV